MKASLRRIFVLLISMFISFLRSKQEQKVTVFFFPFLFFNPTGKKMLKVELVFSFLSVFSHFAVYGQLPVAAPPVTCVTWRTTKTCRPGGVLSRLLSTCEFHRGNKGWRCGGLWPDSI